MECETIISEITGDGFYSFTPCTQAQLRWLVQKGAMQGVTTILDERQISPNQRMKIFALISDITCYINGLERGYKGEFTKANKEMLNCMGLLYAAQFADSEAIRYQLMHNYCQLVNSFAFSLSNVDMTTAKDFIDFLCEFCVIHGIPCMDTLLNRCEDVGRYVYACLANKRCCITGKKAQLHHVDAVGAGRNRKDVVHIGMNVLPLCPQLHTEAHTLGKQSFKNKYHVEPVRLDENLCKIWNLKKQK